MILSQKEHMPSALISLKIRILIPSTSEQTRNIRTAVANTLKIILFGDSSAHAANLLVIAYLRMKGLSCIRYTEKAVFEKKFIIKWKILCTFILEKIQRRPMEAISRSGEQ